MSTDVRRICEGLPPFSGDYTRWDRFWLEFDQHINTRPSIHENVKLAALKYLCSDRALNLIQSLGDVSYETAIAALRHSFDDDQLKQRRILAAIEQLPMGREYVRFPLQSIFTELKRLITALQRYQPVSNYYMKVLVKDKFPERMVDHFTSSNVEYDAEWTITKMLDSLEERILAIPNPLPSEFCYLLL